MIRVRKSEDGSTGFVNGSTGDVVLFYVLWKEKVWPNFLAHSGLLDTSKFDPLRVEMEKVLDRTRKGEELVLSIKGKPFREAWDSARTVCGILNVKIEEN